MKYMIKYLFLFLTILAVNAQSHFFQAIGKVESNNNDAAIGDHSNAIGRYQIWRVYYLDAKEFDKSITFSYESLTNKANSEKVMRAYFKRYEPQALKEGNWEILSRLHNAGPNWKNKISKTDSYWRKVKKELDVLWLAGKVDA
jgi:hypothetical protein